MTGLVLLGDGFEISEMTIPCDYLFRADIKTIRASVMKDLKVTSQDQITLIADAFLKDLDVDKFDFLFLPGGKASYTTLINHQDVDKTILSFAKKKKWIFAICAAPSLLGRLGVLSSLDFTCFPGFESQAFGGNFVDKGVVLSENLLTAKSVFYAEEFALKMIEVLKNKESAEQVYHQVRGEK